MVKKVIKKTVTETVQEDNSSKNKEIVTEKPKAKKKTTRRTTSTTKKRMTAREREELLIENFVGLQNAMTNLSIKFGSLSDNISRLLGVYEEAAKSYALNGKTDNEDMLNKINSLLEQNKTIAKGLVLMEAKIRSSSDSSDKVSMQVPQQQVQNQSFSPQSSNYSQPKSFSSSLQTQGNQFQRNENSLNSYNNQTNKEDLEETNNSSKLRPRPLPSI